MTDRVDTDPSITADAISVTHIKSKLGHQSPSALVSPWVT